MIHPLSAPMSATEPPPVMEARRWVEGLAFPEDRPLINVSQAAPVEPPPAEMRQAMAEAILTDATAHIYGPVLGLPELRAHLAERWSAAYGGDIGTRHVAITAGCNQGFCATLATLAQAGDEVILPTPWYFNHKMWCDMAGLRVRALPCGPGMVPDVAEAEALLTPRTKAIILVTPNNPSGAEYPAQTLTAFRDLARARGIALIVDETYRDFDSRPAPAHDLFADPAWDDTLIHLYSFSKAYRLTGHRVGAMVASPERLSQVEKFLDTVSICAPQLGQRAALWGMRNLDDWLAGERAEILSRRAAIAAALPSLPGWEILGCGAYFAYCRHPFEAPSNELAPRLVKEAGVLALPGTMFRPADDPSGAREFRFAFANVDATGIAALMDRLRTVTC